MSLSLWRILILLRKSNKLEKNALTLFASITFSTAACSSSSWKQNEAYSELNTGLPTNTQPIQNLLSVNSIHFTIFQPDTVGV